MNKDKIILDLCGGTGSWSKPYKDAGYLVFTITLPEYDILLTEFVGTTIRFIGKDKQCLTVRKSEVYGILAAPPCTKFSRAAWQIRSILPKRFLRRINKVDN